MPKINEKKVPVPSKPEIICREAFRVKLFSLDLKDRQGIEKQMKRLASSHNLKKTSGFFSVSRLRNGQSIVYHNSGEKVVFMDLLMAARTNSSKGRIVK